MSMKQQALDELTGAVIEAVFGSPRLPPIIEKGMKFVGFDIEKITQRIDSYIEPFMDESGLINGDKLRGFVEIKSPQAAKLIPQGKFNAIDRVKEISSGVKQIRKAIENETRGNTSASLPRPRNDETENAGNAGSTP